MSQRVGIDTGGTFTDFVGLGPAGLIVHKVRTTQADQSEGILDGLNKLGQATTGRGGRHEIVHGSTVATNAVLERRGARVALVTTAGFEDVLAIGRQTRPELYNFFVAATRPLVPPDLTFGVVERLDARGRVLVDLDESGLARIARDIRARGAEIVAICFLHAYVNPAHEQRAAVVLRAHGLVVCTSHEILPEYREYERWSTTAVNAYVTPLIDRYLGSLERRLAGQPLTIMQSNGGAISSATARAQAVRTVLSGPAAGVVGARAVAIAAGFPRAISFDMGGTSTDVSLIDGEMATSTESTIGDVPVRLPVIDIHTVGAGGGSIAYLDSGGALRVGPRSAGSNPGPVCYGIGTDLTVTDANLLLGRLDPAFFLGGRMALDVARVERIAADRAREWRMRVADLAEGIVRVANANMERAIRVVSVERGHDPREFVLVAFGGAGGMHACEIARELEIASVLVPRHAGVLSALGMLVADVTRDYAAAVLRPASALGAEDLDRAFRPLVDRAARELRREGFTARRQQIDRLIDVRYRGQSYEITLPWQREYLRAFHDRHGTLYGYSNPDRATEVVAVRVRAAGLTVKPALPYSRPRRTVTARPTERRPGRFGGRQVSIAFHRWDDLAPGARSAGPAVITGGEATVVVPPGFGFRVDGFGNLVLRPARRGKS